MDKLSPLVSVFMMTYNHERYISQALDSILSQKVLFDYEVVLGDDCSIDGTKEIVLSYKDKYPDKIKLLLHKKNIGAAKNQIEVFNNCSGKYIAICEGDDYWTDPYKLQKQISFLEERNDCNISFHNYSIVDRNDVYVSNGHTLYYKDILGLDDIINGLFPKTCTVVFRRSAIERIDLAEVPFLNDIVLWVLILLDGSYAMKLNDNMACYRIHENGVWSLQSRAKRRAHLIKQTAQELSIIKSKPKSFILHSGLVSLYIESAIDLLQSGEIKRAKEQITKATDLLFDIESFGWNYAIKYIRFYYLFFKRVVCIIRFHLSLWSRSIKVRTTFPFN